MRFLTPFKTGSSSVSSLANDLGEEGRDPESEQEEVVGDDKLLITNPPKSPNPI